MNDLLPNEIVQKLLGYLEYRELLMSSRTCRRWKYVADQIFKKSKVSTKGIQKSYHFCVLLYINVHFPFPVLITGGRFRDICETPNPYYRAVENDRLRNSSTKTEILGSNQTLEPHPEIWGHSLALTNDYRILFCGGIKTLKEEEKKNKLSYDWWSWGQGKYLVIKISIFQVFSYFYSTFYLAKIKRVL